MTDQSRGIKLPPPPPTFSRCRVLLCGATPATDADRKYWSGLPIVLVTTTTVSLRCHCHCINMIALGGSSQHTLAVVAVADAGPCFLSVRASGGTGALTPHRIEQ